MKKSSNYYGVELEWEYFLNHLPEVFTMDDVKQHIKGKFGLRTFYEKVGKEPRVTKLRYNKYLKINPKTMK